jgi:uncharacterized protein (DUF1330 family)
MTGYLIVNIEVRDPDAYAKYRQAAAPLVEKFGGRYLVRGGDIQPLEGDLGLKRLVVLEFPSVESARRFYESPEYAPVLRMRLESTKSDAVLVAGYRP